METYVSQFPDARVRRQAASKQKQSQQWNQREHFAQKKPTKTEPETQTRSTHTINTVCLTPRAGESFQKGEKTGGLRLLPPPPGGAADCEEEGRRQDKEGMAQITNPVLSLGQHFSHPLCLVSNAGGRRDGRCQGSLWGHQWWTERGVANTLWKVSLQKCARAQWQLTTHWRDVFSLFLVVLDATRQSSQPYQTSAASCLQNWARYVHAHICALRHISSLLKKCAYQLPFFFFFFFFLKAQFWSAKCDEGAAGSASRQCICCEGIATVSFLSAHLILSISNQVNIVWVSCPTVWNHGAFLFSSSTFHCWYGSLSLLKNNTMF